MVRYTGLDLKHECDIVVQSDCVLPHMTYYYNNYGFSSAEADASSDESSDNPSPTHFLRAR